MSKKKLSTDDVIYIRLMARARRSWTNKALARRYGVSKSHIEHIIAGTKRAKAGDAA